jgi:hypothetical protein
VFKELKNTRKSSLPRKKAAGAFFLKKKKKKGRKSTQNAVSLGKKLSHKRVFSRRGVRFIILHPNEREDIRNTHTHTHTHTLAHAPGTRFENTKRISLENYSD